MEVQDLVCRPYDHVYDYATYHVLHSSHSRTPFPNPAVQSLASRAVDIVGHTSLVSSLLVTVVNDLTCADADAA